MFDEECRQRLARAREGELREGVGARVQRFEKAFIECMAFRIMPVCRLVLQCAKVVCIFLSDLLVDMEQRYVEVYT